MAKWQTVSFSFYLLTSLILFVSGCGAKKKTIDSNESKYSFPSKEMKTIEGKKGGVVEYYSGVLDVPITRLNSKLYLFIDDWRQTPHRFGGVDKLGVDCSAFVTFLYYEVYNQQLPRTSRDMGELVKRKYESQLNEGDLVFFSFGGKGIDHVGVYLHNGKFVHVSTKAGVVVSNLKDPWYYKYLVRCGTLNN